MGRTHVRSDVHIRDGSELEAIVYPTRLTVNVDTMCTLYLDRMEAIRLTAILSRAVAVLDAGEDIPYAGTRVEE